LAAYVPDEADLPDAIAFCGQIKEEAKLKRQRIKGGAGARTASFQWA